MTRERVVGPRILIVAHSLATVSAIAATMPAGQSEKRLYIIGQQELERHDRQRSRHI